VARSRYTYFKSKSLPRELIQKIFLKLLLKLFPKKFLLYKEKIRFIMNKSGFLLRLYLVSTYLRFRYPLYFKIPAKHLYAVGLAIKFLKILKPQKIDFFLTSGSLLGAVRQGSFAGRPSDVDFGIKEEQLPKLLNAIPLLIKNGARFIRKRSSGKLIKLQILFHCMLVDVGIFKKKKVGKKEMWFNEDERRYNSKLRGFTFSLDRLTTIKAYGREFMAPANPEIYLEIKFGKNWRTPDKKQFFWNKKNLKQKL